MSDHLFDKIVFRVFNMFYLDLLKQTFPGAVGTFIYTHRRAFMDVQGFDDPLFSMAKIQETVGGG